MFIKSLVVSLSSLFKRRRGRRGQACGAEDAAASEALATPPPTFRRLIFSKASVAFVVISCLLGLLFYRVKLERARAGLLETLKTMAHLKAQEVAAWRSERTNDMAILAEAVLLPRSAPALLSEQSSTNAASRIAQLLERYRLAYGYRSVALFGRDSRVVLASPGGFDPAREADPALLVTMHQMNGPRVGDIVRGSGGGLTVGFLAPVGLAKTDGYEGAVLLVADLERSVTALLKHSGSALASAEAILLSEDSGHALHVSLGNARIPPASPETESGRPQDLARFFGSGVRDKGSFGGADERGNQAVGAFERVDDSKWIVVYKVDPAELVPPALQETLKVVAGTFFLLSLVGAVLKVRSQGRELQLVERQLASDRAAAEALRRLGMILQCAKDVLLLVDENMRIAEANGCTMEFYGRQPHELLGLNVAELRVPELRGETRSVFEKVMTSPGMTFETVHARADGSGFPVEVKCTPIQIAGRHHVLSIVRDITVRKEAEEHLNQRNLLLAAVFSQAADSVIVFDGASWRFVEFNVASYQTLGYPREAFSELRFIDLFPSGQAERLRSVVGQIDPNQSAAFDSMLHNRTGHLRHVFVKLTRLSIGKLDRIAATWTDITERRKAEENALVENLRTTLLLELHKRSASMTDVELYGFALDLAARFTDSSMGFAYRVSEHGGETHITGWSKRATDGNAVTFGTQLSGPASERWLGYVRQRKTVISDDHSGPIHPWDQEEPSPHDGQARRFMGTPLMEDGSVQCLLGVAGKDRPYTAADAGHLEFLASELTKLMAERTTGARLRQLSYAVDQSPATIVITDTSGAIVYANAKFVETTGYTLEESLGKNPRILKSGQMPENRYQELWETILRGETWRGELCNKRRSGELYWELASISPIKDPTGRTTHFIAVKEDITHRRRLEEELRQSQKLEAIGQLAGGVAHDFNNILAAMMLQLSLLQSSPGIDGEALLALSDLLAEARRASSLVRQLLMFSRKSVLQIRWLRPGEVVRGLMRMLKPLIGENISLSFDSAPDVPGIEADAGMIEQVVVNLVLNARDAISKSGQIEIRLGRVRFGADAGAEVPSRRAGEFVCLSVSDTGCGMDTSTVARIFEPFFTTKEQGAGTGLGLATVHGIVAQHKGWVEVRSQVGVGTTFDVYFPAKSGQESQESQAVPVLPFPRGTERILLVEDERLLRRQVQAVLASLGYQVHAAEDAAEAMAVWRSASEAGAFDLLLTDMIMPGGTSGLELAQELLRLKPGLKVVISSGYSNEVVEGALRDNPGITFLPKPYELAQLARTLRECLGVKAET